MPAGRGDRPHLAAGTTRAGSSLLPRVGGTGDAAGGEG